MTTGGAPNTLQEIGSKASSLADEKLYFNRGGAFEIHYLIGCSGFWSIWVREMKSPDFQRKCTQSHPLTSSRLGNSEAQWDAHLFRCGALPDTSMCVVLPGRLTLTFLV